jgi:multisubunit Na+/H+ antiporter MnhC subunit
LRASAAEFTLAIQKNRNHWLLFKRHRWVKPVWFGLNLLATAHSLLITFSGNMAGSPYVPNLSPARDIISTALNFAGSPW